jgi:hypothetical protein
LTRKEEEKKRRREDDDKTRQEDTKTKRIEDGMLFASVLKFNQSSAIFSHEAF